MKKSDLKSGDIIEVKKYKENNLGLLVETELGMLIQYNQSWDMMSHFDEDLYNSYENDIDIISVRRMDRNNHVIRNFMNEAPVIWRREEEREYSFEEIKEYAEKHLGHKIKIVNK